MKKKKDFRVYRNQELSLYLFQQERYKALTEDLKAFLEAVETDFLYRHEQLMDVIETLSPMVAEQLKRKTAA